MTRIITTNGSERIEARGGPLGSLWGERAERPFHQGLKNRPSDFCLKPSKHGYARVAKPKTPGCKQCFVISETTAMRQN
jgi:hypothetical protein